MGDVGGDGLPPKAPVGDSAELKLRGYWCESAAGSVIREFGNDPEGRPVCGAVGRRRDHDPVADAGWRIFAPALEPPSGFAAAGGWCGR